MELTLAREVLQEYDERSILTAPLFANWYEPQRDRVGSVKVNEVYARDDEIRMLHLSARGSGNLWPTAVFLRGATVEILPVLNTPHGRYVVLVEQYRIAVGQFVLSTPAGMIDAGEEPGIAGLRELDEETNTTIRWGKPVPLNIYLSGSDRPMVVSPGGTDEEVTFFEVEGTIDADAFALLQDKVAGLAHEGERTTVRLKPEGKALEALSADGRKPCLKSVMAVNAHLIRQMGGGLGLTTS